MLNIVVCDDMESNLNQTRQVMREYLAETRTPAMVKYYTDPQEVLSDAVGADIYIIDMLMPRLDGIQTALRIRETTPNAKIICTSSVESYAVDSYGVQAEDYIIYPLNPARIRRTMNNVVRELRQEQFFVDTKDGHRKVRFDKLNYVICDKRYLHYHLEGGEVFCGLSVRGSVAQALGSILHQEQMFYVAPSLAVNLSRVETLNREWIQFEDKEKVYYPKSHFREIDEAWRKLGTPIEVLCYQSQISE